MKVALFSRTVFKDGAPLFEAGKEYPLTEETRKQIKRGYASEAEAKEAEPKAAPAKPELTAELVAEAAKRVKEGAKLDDVVDELTEKYATTAKAARRAVKSHLAS